VLACCMLELRECLVSELAWEL